MPLFLVTRFFRRFKGVFEASIAHAMECQCENDRGNTPDGPSSPSVQQPPLSTLAALSVTPADHTGPEVEGNRYVDCDPSDDEHGGCVVDPYEEEEMAPQRPSIQNNKNEGSNPQVDLESPFRAKNVVRPPMPWTNTTADEELEKEIEGDIVRPPMPWTNETTDEKPEEVIDGDVVRPPMPWTNMTAYEKPKEEIDRDAVRPPMPWTNERPQEEVDGDAVRPPMPWTNATTGEEPEEETKGKSKGKPGGKNRKPKEKPQQQPTKQTEDGLCGPSNGNTICGDWFAGSCCSPYGFCGNTTSHCGPGCQSGACLQENIYNLLSPNTYQPDMLDGVFEVVGESGVPAMSAALMPNNRVIFIDKVENYTQLVLDNGQYAYSAEYDPVRNTVKPLSYKTNAFCSGGTFLEDGRLVSIGGNAPLAIDPTVGDGFQGIRYLTRPMGRKEYNGQSWDEPGHQISTPRWYASVQTLPDGAIWVVSGSLTGFDPSEPENNNPTYEFLDKNGYPLGGSVLYPILERNQPYYMYPFLHLLKDGNVFVFVSRSAEIFNPRTEMTVKTLPDLPGDYRTYPNTGGSIMFPLSAADGWEPEVMICGGGSYVEISSPSDPSCGRIRPLARDPDWEMELMPTGRVMVEGMVLPDGTALWINGCNRGAQGFGIAKDPTYDALIYDPEGPLGDRWSIAGTSNIARMYHSVALLLLDGTVMIAGSNPVEQPILVANPDDPMQAFVTEFRVEIYTPHYLLGDKVGYRPYDVFLPAKYLPADGRRFIIDFKVYGDVEEVKVVLYHGGFVTHSLHMGHRMLYLFTEGFQPGRRRQRILATMPPDCNIAPPGPYVVYVVANGIPSVGQFVMVEVHH
ncbi:hypothetical protein FQN55_000693 [Onygenales sp. PD_40]|nr:hypothetical protein FQN55_000693 [Onygenales sp. PD_40]